MTAGGYDVPGPVGADYFNEEQDAIKRRRLQLESMLAEPKGVPGLAGGIANLALGITKGYHAGNLQDQERDLSQRRSAAAQEWLSRMPQDTPAQPEFQAQIPKQPVVDDEGNPMPSADGGPTPSGGTFRRTT